MGSGDVYDLRGRRPWAGVNFITAHDGFTLNDLVSYDCKHNEANGEGNNDGHNDNRSFNYGAEGATDDEGINAVRERQKRNFLATLLLSHGTPMLLAGDEFGRSQMGNNNCYCQDSELSWFHWEDLPGSAAELREFVERLVQLRQDHAILRRDNWRDGMQVQWLNPGGGEQTEEQWDDAGGTTIGLRLAIDVSSDRDGWNEVFIFFNPHDGEVSFKLPDHSGRGWIVELSTAELGKSKSLMAQEIVMQPRSMTLLRAA